MVWFQNTSSARHAYVKMISALAPAGPPAGLPLAPPTPPTPRGPPVLAHGRASVSKRGAPLGSDPHTPSRPRPRRAVRQERVRPPLPLGVQDVILPMRQSSILGARFLKAVKWQADFIYLDSAHEVHCCAPPRPPTRALRHTDHDVAGPACTAVVAQDTLSALDVRLDVTRWNGGASVGPGTW